MPTNISFVKGLTKPTVVTQSVRFRRAKTLVEFLDMQDVLALNVLRLN
jgi:hypothetical protein